MNSWDEFFQKYRNYAFGYILKKIKDEDIAEDLTQEVFTKLYSAFSNPKEIKYPKAYIIKTAKSCCVDYFRKNPPNSLFNDNKDIDDLIQPVLKTRFIQPEKRIIYNELENQTYMKKLKTISPEKLKGLENSIDFILAIYEFKNQKRLYTEDNIPYLKTKTILYKAYKKIEEIFSPPTEEEILFVYELLKPRIKSSINKELPQFLCSSGPKNKFIFLKRYFERRYVHDPELLKMYYPNKEFKKYPEELSKLNYQYSLYEDNKYLLKSIKRAFLESMEKIEKKMGDESLYLKGFILPDGFEFFLKNASIIKADPVTLIFRVWKKALKKNELIKNLLLEFKEKYKKTMWAPIFKSLDKSFNIETWRKKVYRKYKNKAFYDKLTNYIYEKSFIEKISPFSWR